MIPRYDAHIESSIPNYGLVSPMESNTTNKAQSKTLTFEDFKTLGFEPINKNILKGTDRIYLYFHAEKAYIMAPINVLTEEIISTSRNFICFETSSSDSLALLYRENDHRGPFYKTIFQDGTQMQGKGEYPIDEMICHKTEDEIEALKKTPLSEQLINLGFSEVPCNQQIFQRTQEERMRLIGGHEAWISGLLKGFKMFEEMYASETSETELAKFEKMKLDYNQIVLGHQLSIEQLKNEKEWHMQVFTKIIPNDPLKIFMVILKDGALEDISTTIHRADSTANREIKGCIISADFGEHKNQRTAPKFELVDLKGEKFKVSFRHGSNTHRDYFVVNCEPLN